MYTKGQIHKVYPNGTISYVGSETRSDGVPLAVLDEVDSPDNERGARENLRTSVGDDEAEDDEVSEEEDEDEVILGKGFDYESSDKEDDVHFPHDDSKDEWDETYDDYDELERQKQQDDGEEALEPPGNSFSTISPAVLNDKDKLDKDFPDIVNCPSCEIELRAGQCLFLPSGWFHEVTSFSETGRKQKQASQDYDQDSGLSGCHVAANYWFYPPDNLTNYYYPYQAEYLKKFKV